MSTRNTMLAVAVLATLSACGVAPPPKSEDIRPQAMPNVATPGQWSVEGAAAGPVAGTWLATFVDARLQALVTEALAYNPDLRVAATRVELASEYANLADTTLWPQVDLLARGGGEMSGDSSGQEGVGLFANWELDLWGRVRSARAGSVAGYESVVADAEYARQSVAALVAKSYFLAVEAGLQLRLAVSRPWPRRTSWRRWPSNGNASARATATTRPWHGPMPRRSATRSKIFEDRRGPAGKRSR